jgi:hypothetical protein
MIEQSMKGKIPPLAALQNINAVDRGHGENRVPLMLQLTLAVAGFNDAQFSLQYFRQKIPRPAGRFNFPLNQLIMLGSTPYFPFRYDSAE